MIPVLFLVIGGGFVATLLKALFRLISTDWDQENFSKGTMIALFKWPLMFFVLFIVFVMWGIPILEDL